MKKEGFNTLADAFKVAGITPVKSNPLTVRECKKLGIIRDVKKGNQRDRQPTK